VANRRKKYILHKRWEELLNLGRNENLSAGLKWPCSSPAWGKKLRWPSKKVGRTPREIHAFVPPSRMERPLICRKIALRPPSKGRLIKTPKGMKNMYTKGMARMAFLFSSKRRRIIPTAPLQISVVTSARQGGPWVKQAHSILSSNVNLFSGLPWQMMWIWKSWNWNLSMAASKSFM